jgi:GNAT superfamily N-acetyltransferase
MTKSDLKDVFLLQKEFETYLRSLSARHRATSAIKRERRLRKDGFGKNPAFYGFVARQNRVLLGYLCYHFGYDPDEMQGRVVYVIDLFVTKETRGRGVGMLLMKEVARLCRRIHGIDVYFCVWRRNKSAIRFYKSLGADWVKDVPLMRWDKNKW